MGHTSHGLQTSNRRGPCSSCCLKGPVAFPKVVGPGFQIKLNRCAGLVSGRQKKPAHFEPGVSYANLSQHHLAKRIFHEVCSKPNPKNEDIHSPTSLESRKRVAACFQLWFIELKPKKPGHSFMHFFSGVARC